MLLHPNLPTESGQALSLSRGARYSWIGFNMHFHTIVFFPQPTNHGLFLHVDSTEIVWISVRNPKQLLMLDVVYIRAMAFQEKHLFIKRSSIKNAGKGLFTSISIPKGTVITEHTGDIKTWKEIVNAGYFNPYVFYINRSHVIDAMGHKEVLARYANDAKGISDSHSFSNNCRYEVDGLRVYVTATKDISAGSEILVGYGKQYWDAIKLHKKP